MQSFARYCAIFDHLHGHEIRYFSDRPELALWARKTRFGLPSPFAASPPASARMIGVHLQLACGQYEPYKHMVPDFIAGMLCADAYDDAPTREGQTLLHYRAGDAYGDMGSGREAVIWAWKNFRQKWEKLPPTLKADRTVTAAMAMAEVAGKISFGGRREAHGDLERQVLITELFGLHVERLMAKHGSDGTAEVKYLRDMASHLLEQVENYNTAEAA